MTWPFRRESTQELKLKEEARRIPSAPSERTAFTSRLTLLLWNNCLITLAIAQRLLMP